MPSPVLRQATFSSRPTITRPRSRATTTSVVAFKLAPLLTRQPTWASDGQMLDRFLVHNPWARRVVSIVDSSHQQMQELLEPMHVLPTKDAPSGVLYAKSRDGAACEFKVETHTGSSLIRHKFVSTGTFSISTVSGAGVLHMKLGAQPTTMKQGTPFLEVALAGNETEGLQLLMVLVPRLNTLVHAHYITKYFRHTPASYIKHMQAQKSPVVLPVPARAPIDLPGPGGKPMASFQDLYKRLSTYNVRASTAAAGMDAMLLKPYHVSQVWTRLLEAHACSFTVDPTDDKAMQALADYMQEFVALWCAWVAADATAPELSEPLLSECRTLSSLMGHHLHPEHDEAVEFSKRLLGDEATQIIGESMSGENAHSPAALWWPGAEPQYLTCAAV